MPVTKDQAYAIARVVNALRPEWDEPGIRAALRPVAGRNPLDVAMAALRAAADSGASNPGVIPTEGPHWREKLSAVRPKDPAYAVIPYDEACAHCAVSEYHCTAAQKWADPEDGHQFVSRRQAAINRARAEARDRDFTPSTGSYYPPHRRNEIEAELRAGLARAEAKQEEIAAMKRPVDAQTGEDVAE